MPGIFGAFIKNRKGSLPDLMNKMIASMDNDRELRVDKFVDGEKEYCMGRISLGIFNNIPQPVKDRTGKYSIMFHGELYNNPGPLSDPEHIIALYLQRGDACAAELNGVFHFTIYDAQSDKIKLFSDKFGLQPLYYSLLSVGIIYAAEVKAVLQERTVAKEPDYRSFADFLHFGQILGTKTLFKNIALLAPGSVLTFNTSNNEMTLYKYFDLEDLFAEKGQYSAKLSADDVVSVLVQSIKSRLRHKEAMGLSLSGGLDSRGILAGMGKDSEGICTYTLGLSGCADQKLAEMMAQAAGTRHEFIELDQSYLSNYQAMADSMIHLSDGMYHPHESTEMLALEYFKKAPFKILLRGHGGEIAKAALAYPVMATPEVYSCSHGTDILNYIFDITNLVIRDNDPVQLFTSSFNERIGDAARQSLEESCGRASELLAPADLCIYYYINEHIRRQVIASLEIFRTEIELRLPYVDEEFIKLLLSLPVHQRNKGEIHRALVKKCMPGLIKIPDSNTGAPLDAGPMRLFFTDKFNSVMKRLRISGFRHYTDFEDWQRKSFRETTEGILFSNRLKDRDIYNTESLKSVFDGHISGRKNYAHLLGTVVGLELWFRQFVD